MLTTAEAGAILGCSACTVRNLCQAGKLPATKFGRAWMISPEAIVALKLTDRRPYWYRKFQELDSRPLAE